MSGNQVVKDGRVPDGTRLSSSTEPQEGLRPTGFDPSRADVWGATVAFLQRDGTIRLVLTGGGDEQEVLNRAMGNAQAGDTIIAKLSAIIAEVSESAAEHT